MIRKLLLICAGLLVGCVSLFAFTAREPRADFTYVNPSGIHTLDPARMSWTQDIRVALNIWEGLTTWDPQTLEPIGGAAIFPPRLSPDRLVYTFTIRDDARWSNGDSVTARDFIRGWRRGMEPGTAADYTFLFTDHIAGAAEYVQWRNEAVGALAGLKNLSSGRTMRAAHAADLETRFETVGAKALNDRTLEVRLKRPCPYFLDLTAFPTFLPCHESIERLREREGGSLITAEGLVVYDPQWTKPDYRRNDYPGLLTNGPYMLADWTFKRRARLRVNPYFRAADQVRCRTIDMLEYDNVSASIMAYEAGDVDFLTDMSVPYDHEIARLARTGERPDFHSCVLAATYFLSFNCKAPVVGGRVNPFVEPRVRKAFSLAVDRQRIVENVLNRGDSVAHSFVPPGAMPGYVPPNGLPRDVEGARRLLAEAGFADGAGMGPVELLYVPSDERLCQAVARMWEEALGVRVELRSQESKTFAEEKANQRFMIARGNWYADYNDPTTFLDCLGTGNGNNDSGYSNPRYDELLAAAGVTTNPAARADLLRQAEAIIVEEDCPILPILHYSETVAIQPHVKGLFPNARLWFPFRYVTVGRRDQGGSVLEQ
jgi:oligopeptide transport system substrate-binding protein